MNKYFKKLFSLFLLIGIGTLTVLVNTNTTFASDPYAVVFYNADNDQQVGVLEHTEDTLYFYEDGEDEWGFAGNSDVILETYGDYYVTVSEKYSSVVIGSLILTDGTHIDVTQSESQFVEIGGVEFYLDEYYTVTYNRIKDDKKPVISGETTFVTNVDDARDALYFMQFLYAEDETDGDVTDSLVIILDNYTANKRVLGNHTFTVQASDKSGNKTTVVLNVRVVDITKPVINGVSAIVQIGYKETYNIENFRKTLTVTDNYDTLTNADIKVKTDGYTANKTKLGTYDIVFNVKDSSNNEGVFTKQVKVIDNVKPTFSGPSVISTSNNTVLTESAIRAQITAHDDIDGNLTGRIELVEDNFTGNGNVVGSYTIKYKVTDNANNTEFYTVTIQRLDKIPPTIWVQDGVSIRTNPSTPLTYQMIIDILTATGQVQVNATTTFSFPLDEYTGNETEPGIYAMSVVARSTDGNESINNLSITVHEGDVGGIDVNPDFNLAKWFSDNMITIIVTAAAITGVIIIVVVNKKKKR